MFKKIIINASILASTLVLIPLNSYASTYGSNFLNTATVTADTTDTACPYNAPNYTIDGNLATTWCPTNTALPHWLKYQLGTAKTIGKLSIWPEGDVNGTQIKNFNIEGSNDNSTWTTIYTNITANTQTSAQRQDFELTTSTSAFTYYKLNITSSWNSAYNRTIMFEVEAYECTDCSVATSTASSTITTNTGNFMSPELDQLLIYILEGLIVISTGYGLYKFLK